MRNFVILILKMLWRQRMINLYWNDLRRLRGQGIVSLTFQRMGFFSQMENIREAYKRVPCKLYPS